MNEVKSPRILVIKLGALGDFIQALGPFAAIRKHHPDAHIALLTTLAFAEIGRQTGLFDEVNPAGRPAWWRIDLWSHLLAWMHERGFARVYDLQTSKRSAAIFQLILTNRRPEWSGIARGCSHPHANPNRDRMHTIDRQREQLQMAGIAVPAADVAFLKADLGRFKLPARYALLVPGGSARRPGKRWPAERYARLAELLSGRGITPVVLGGKDEVALCAKVAGQGQNQGRNLAGQTSLAEIAALARGAAAAVGNDTGPMHLIAAAGCPSLALFSSNSDPALCAPRGEKVEILRRPRLAELGVDEVAAAMSMR